MAVLPCFLCGKPLDLRTDKNRKRYVICNSCGLQAFVRRAQGLENLDRLIRTLKGRDLPLREHAHNLFQIRAILEELDGIEGELEKLDNSISIFSKTRQVKNRARKLLKQRMQTLLDDLERIAG
jgi:exonuclease VII small subunit